MENKRKAMDLNYDVDDGLPALSAPPFPPADALYLQLMRQSQAAAVRGLTQTAKW